MPFASIVTFCHCWYYDCLCYIAVYKEMIRNTKSFVYSTSCGFCHAGVIKGRKQEDTKDHRILCHKSARTNDDDDDDDDDTD